MTVEITIIGLGRTGSAFGLALSEHKQLLHRKGHDKDYAIGQNAQKKGAIDQHCHNLHDAVKDADLVLITTPLDQISPILEQISSDLKEGTLVLDTSQAKKKVAEWMMSFLPEGCHYIGLTPVINPQYLSEEETVTHADLYKDSIIAICAPPNTPAEAYKLATDLVAMVGAQPLFVDLFEIDGLISAAEISPKLISSALVRSVILQPGWQEARKFAGRNFWDIGLPSSRFTSATELAQTWQANQENLERLLEEMIGTLKLWRDYLRAGELPRLINELESAQQDFNQWQEERRKSKWNEYAMPGGWDQIPSSSDRLGGVFGMNLFRKKKKEGGKQ